MIYETTDQSVWETVPSVKGGSFLQSWNWNQTTHNQSCHFFVDHKKNPTVGAVVIERGMPGGFKYWDLERFQALAEFVSQVAEEAQKRNIVFLRATPEYEWGHRLGPDLKELGFIFPTLMRRSHSPSATLLVDLQKDEKQLLAEMHPKTRYNIRVAERHGVEVVSVDATDPQVFAKFWHVMEETAKRDGITLLSQQHYLKMLNLKKNPHTILLFARIREEVLAVMILVVHGATVTYLHGGSSSQHRQMMASTLLQWEAIKLAKKLGCSTYDFWGIAIEGPGSQPQDLGWAGITRFKKGFGGREVRYLGTKDLPLRPFLYKILTVAAQLRSN